MIFSAKWAGHDFPIPDPERSEQLRGFVLAYRQLKLKLEGGEPDKAQVDTVSTLRPRADLGLLSLTHANVPPAKVRLDEEDEEEDVVPDISHHVALMREPELVVNYHAGPSMPVSGVGYAGVFRAADELNGHFAAAERPTHDGWNPNLLEDDNARRNVRIALERISERLRVFIEPYGQTPTSDATARLASFARIMGSLIPTSDGPGAEVQPLRQTSTGGKSASRRPATVVPLGTPETLEIGGRLVTRIWFRIEHALTDGTTTIEVKPSIGVLDGATRESAPPLGEETPEVLCWRSKSGHAVATGCAKYVMPTSDEDRWGVDIFTPRNSLLLVDMRAESSSE
jgi:hypothetical protein